MRILAQITSYLFHPLFGLFYALFLLICLKPHLLGAIIWSEQSLLLILIFIYSCLVPAIAFALLRFTGLLKSINMEDRFDRFGPLIVCAIFNLWLWVNLKSQPNIPKILIAFVLSSVLCILISFALNTKFKLSLHAVGAGSFVTLWIVVRYFHSEDGVLYFRFVKESLSSFHLNGLMALSMILAGWIGSCRLYLKAHDPFELYLGYAVGVFSTILAFSYTF